MPQGAWQRLRQPKPAQHTHCAVSEASLTVRVSDPVVPLPFPQPRSRTSASEARYRAELHGAEVSLAAKKKKKVSKRHVVGCARSRNSMYSRFLVDLMDRRGKSVTKYESRKRIPRARALHQKKSRGSLKRGGRSGKAAKARCRDSCDVLGTTGWVPCCGPGCGISEFRFFSK
jgi:hypothetical protein